MPACVDEPACECSFPDDVSWRLENPENREQLSQLQAAQGVWGFFIFPRKCHSTPIIPSINRGYHPSTKQHPTRTNASDLPTHPRLTCRYHRLPASRCLIPVLIYPR